MISRLASEEVLNFLVILLLMLASARVLGQLARRLKLPSVVGELTAGILLGPSVLGSISPDSFSAIFTSHPSSYKAFDGLCQIGIILLMFVAGMEVEFSTIRQYGKSAASVSIAGIVFPFAVAFITVWFLYDMLFEGSSGDRTTAALFLGTALSITALSVIVKILMDINMLKTKVGGVILSAAMIDDFISWIFFSIIIKMMHVKGDHQAVFTNVVFVLLFTAFMLTAGRYLVNRLISFNRLYLNKKGGALTAGVLLCIAAAVLTEFLGIRGIFGAFLMGIAVGESKYFTEKAKDVIHQFISNIFAPLFFASIGLRVNFITNFDLTIVLIVLLIACVAKIVGAFIGSRLSGMKMNESLAVAAGMNARGSMEIVLGLVAFQAGLINEKMFIALVVMTMVTAMIAGPMIKYFIGEKESLPLESKPA